MGGQVRAGESFGELSQRGFQLAYFIAGDRQAAIQILCRAWNKLDARIKQQSKRAYWRDKYLKRWVNKISNTDADTLQWLIYFESEEFEKRQEQDGDIDAETVAIRYIKSAVKISTAMSSFYVAVGIHRLLYDYSTAEIQRVYELVTERYLGADEYRRAKRVVMNSLALRFGDRLTTVKAAHGEIRFELVEDQARWSDLVNRCLNAFTPWSTLGRCPVPADFGANCLNLPPELSGNGKSAVTPDYVETNRCHAFIDLACYGRLVRALGIDPPEKRLALPKFQMGNSGRHDSKPRSSPEPSELTAGEKEIIRESLADEARRRAHAASQSMRVLVDGVELGRIQMDRPTATQFELAEGSKLVEFWGQHENGELLLATYLLQYSEALDITPSNAIIRAGGATVSISVTGAADEPAYLTIMPRASAYAREESSAAPFAARIFAYGALTMSFVFAGWMLRLVRDRNETDVQHTRIERLQRQIAETKPASALAVATEASSAAVVTRALVPYDLGTRGEMNSITTVSLAAGATILRLELPTSELSRKPFRAVLRKFPQQTELLSEQVERISPDGRVFVEVPVTLLSADKDYLVDLRRVTSSGIWETASTFVFHIVKMKE